MCGWLSCEIVFASRSNRSLNCASSRKPGGRILMATLRSSRVSRAFQTSPIPPAPTRETISYGPRRVPAETTVMSVGPARIIPHAGSRRAPEQLRSPSSPDRIRRDAMSTTRSPHPFTSSRSPRSTSPISIARPPHPFTHSRSPRSISPHINRTSATPIHTLAGGHDRYHPISIARPPHPFTRSPESTIDITPYQSHVSPHPFTRSPRPRSISPHINRTSAAPVHALAEATIDITPYRSHVRRTRSHAPRGHD